MTQLNASQARNKFFSLIENVAANNDVARITSRAGNAIIMSEDEYNSLQETLYLMSVPGMWDSIVAGVNTPLEECIKINEL
jgi:prevent-host-death family protein